MERWKELGDSTPQRLRQQLEFILEIDHLKSVLRRSYLIDVDRHENSAEHSWHLALAAMVLAENAKEPIDVGKVIRLVLVHGIRQEQALTKNRPIDDGSPVLWQAAESLITQALAK
jgi:HD domain